MKRWRIPFRPATRYPSSLPSARKRGKTRKTLRRSELQRRAVLIHGVKLDWPSPDPLNVVDHLATALQIEPATVGLVVVKQLERAVELNPRRRDGGRAESILGREQTFVQRIQIHVHHLHLSIGACVITEHLQL